MPKFDSPIKVTSIQSASGNNTLLHLGADNRVGIGIDRPLTKLHVDGAITAAGLVVPASALVGQGDAAEILGFTPNMDEWYIDTTSGKSVVNGYVQVSGYEGQATQSSDAQLGEFSAEFDDDEVVWSREVIFETPLYHDIFLTGTMSYKFDSHTAGTPGLAVTVTHRETANSEFDTRDADGNIIWNSQSTNTFIVPVSNDSKSGDSLGRYSSSVWRATTPTNREITRLKVEIVSTSGTYKDASDVDVHNDGGSSEETILGGGTDYNWNLDGFSFLFNHPDLRVDQLGRITGSFLADATVDDLKIGNFISSAGSLIHDNTAGFGTSVPTDNPNRPADGISTGEPIQGLVSNGTFANGWSLSKTGRIRATDIEIYGPDGTIFFDGRGGDDGNNPFARWATRDLRALDSTTYDYIYGLSFEESNRSNVEMRVGYHGYTGTTSGIAVDLDALYIANTSQPLTGSGNQLANGTIIFNGVTSNAPPGTIFTDGQSVVRNLQGSYILFLSNTQKWSTTTGEYSQYHANTYLGEGGVYVIGKPTVGGWLYHPHGNTTWYSIDSIQSGEDLHENDFIVIGRAGTDESGNFLESITSINTPQSLDSITADEARGSYPPIGITAGGILFADIHINRYNHTANNGEIQLTNPRNIPNTQFTFIHPGTNDPNDSTLYIANGAHGVLMSLEDFPGSRYITFVGANPSRFTFYDDGHSPDFVAAYPIGSRWFYNQDEGRSSEFTPDPRDCIVARVDSNGVSMSGDGSSGITNIYRYAEREATTSEGAVISDMIIDPPRGMASGGIVFADFTINQEFDSSSNTFTANSGFVSFTNPENNPRNEFFVVHPDNPLYFWQTSNVARGVATSLKPTVNATGTRHIAFVGHDPSRFPSIAAYENVSNDFIAVSKYNYQGNPRSDGKWYYDPGSGISDDYVFDVDANDFIIATLSSFNPNVDGIDQITRYAENEGVVIVDGEPITVSSVRNLLNDRIDIANSAATLAIDDAAEAFAEAGYAAANAAQSLGLLDGAITIYLQAEGDEYNHSSGLPSIFANNDHNRNPPFFDYNDLWINTSTYNQAIDGSWLSNAIFRFSNSLGGFDDVDAPSQDGLSWRHDPTNPQGLAYLQGLTARGFADRATNIYFMEKIGSAEPYYGPNVATIYVSGADQNAGREFLNFNPEGDLWFDTTPTGANTNQPFVYRTNTSFSTSNATNSGYANGIGHAGEWAQTAFDYFAGDFDPTTNATGWYNNRDSAFSTATDTVARACATQALTNAENAQAAADREILAFFEAHDVADVPDATGNGDVWIHTDNAIDSTGTKNTSAIYVANADSSGIDSGVVGLYWHPAPNNAIGLMYLESYAAGVSGEFQRGTNLMPRGYSLFDSPLSDYYIKHNAISPSSNITEPFPITSTFSSERISINKTETTNVYFGDSSLKFIHSTGSNDFIFGKKLVINEETGANNYPYSVKIPKAKKFIFSFYAKSNTSVTITPRYYYSNTTHYYAGYTERPSKTTSTNWERYFDVLDLTSGISTVTPAHNTPLSEVISITPYFSFSGASGDNETFIDAIQLEEVPNTVFTASQFKEPSDASSIVFGREITDGKIVTHYGSHYGDGNPWYGPIPNTTPTGYPNPEPNGDFWVNTSNNNIVFRYHQDGTDISTQTVFWSTSTIYGSGWYTTEDLRTGNALSTSYDALANAATAQAAADREILAYFETEAPTASGFGDIWIDIDKYATLNTSAIYVANTQSSTVSAGETPPTPPLYWHSAPNNAVGQVYLNAYLAQRKADRGESLILSVSESGDLPFPVYPDTQGIFVGATGNLVFYKNSRTEYLEDQPAGDDKNTVFVSNRGGIDLVGPRGNIYYPNSGDFGIKDEGYVRIPESMTTVTNSTFSSIYLMYTNMNAVARFELTTSNPFGTHNHIIPVQWNVDTWQTFDLVGTTIDFTPDAANGDFLVAKLNREYAYPEGLESIDRWVFKTLPTQTQAFGDGKIVTHFSPHFPEGNDPGDGTHGPQANLTPTGLYNPDPHGDFWVNTSNNNIIFRYHSNSTNRYAQTAFHAPTKPETNSDEAGWYSTEDVRIANNEQQASNTYDWLANTHDWAIYLDTESANNQLYVNFALANAFFANGVAYNANAAAYLAQAAADREILAFFQPESQIPDATGNGDVWIHTDTLIRSDGTLNTSAIFVANAGTSGGDYLDNDEDPHRWWTSPNNAIGLMYAKSYASGVGGEFQRGTNIMPRGYSLFDAPLSDYNIFSTDPGDGIEEPFAIYHLVSSSNVAIDKTGGANAYNGSSSLRFDAASFEILTFGRSPNASEAEQEKNINYRIDIPKAKKFILSYYIKSDTAINVRPSLLLSNATHDYAGLESGSDETLSTSGWQRLQQIFDFTSGDISGGGPKTEITSFTLLLTYFAAADTFIDAIQMEEVPNTVFTASQFNAPSENAGLVFGRRISDGKIVTHYSNHFISDSTYYGPQPNTTPLGFPNPEPDGDFWVDTGNNQIMFRYNQNNTVNFAQTAYWTTSFDFDRSSDLSGWYSLEDPRTANNEAQASNTYAWLANTDNWARDLDTSDANNVFWVNLALANAINANTAAYVAQASADREINAFFVNHDGTIPTATGNGDIWIHVDNAVYNDPDPAVGATKNTGAIYVANTQTSSIPSGSFFWHQSPNNAIGRMYIDAYAAGITYTDGRVVTHYYDSNDQPYGPSPNTTPSGSLNPYPDGDLWVDTGNNNILFQYNQNSTINWAQSAYWQATTFVFDPSDDLSGWYALEDPRLANTEYWLGQTETSLGQVNVTAEEALQQASRAASAADAEIQIFFEPSTNTTMYATGVGGAKSGPATGNGDIWIHIDNVYDADGNQNTGSIFFANLSPDFSTYSTYSWQASPENAIGRAFLDQFTATGRKNWIPSGYSTWDADVDATGFVFTPNYNIGPGTVQNAETPYPVLTRVPGDIYAGTASVNNTFGKVSSSSLQVVADNVADINGTYAAIFDLSNSGPSARKELWVSEDSKMATFTLPKGKRWIYSYYLYSNSDFISSSISSLAPRLQTFLWFNDSSDPTTNVGYFRFTDYPSQKNKWFRYSHVIDLSNTHPQATADEIPNNDFYEYSSGVNHGSTGNPTTYDGVQVTGGNPLLKDIDQFHVELRFTGATGNTFWIDGIQIEEAPGAQVIAGPFSDPDRRIDSHFARSIADGKIVSHYANGTDGGPTGRYGPRPHRTPSGEINLAPHGDFWIDTGNNNMTYRYNANNSYSFKTIDEDDGIAQTAYWDTVANKQNQVGWYIIRDKQFESDISDAFADLASQFTQITNLEAATDGEIQIFFEEEGGDFVNAIGTYPDAKFGDLWINVSGYNKFANGSLDSNAIFRWQNTSQGYLDPLAWRHAPNNSIGQVYLTTYAAQNAADRRVTSYFQGGTRSGGPPYDSSYKGPQTNATPTGLYNPNPDGDLWIDTGNNNALFVYNYVDGDHATGFSQQIYYGGDQIAEGWYSAEDLRTISSARALEIAAATGTDRVVELFANNIPPSASGNGDIWVKTSDILNTDGSANLNAIYVANTTFGGIQENEPSTPEHYWYSTPTSTLGRSFLERMVAETGKNYIPRGYSLFDSGSDNYAFMGSFKPSVDGADRQKPYRIYFSDFPSPRGLDTTFEIVNSTTGNAYFGQNSLRYLLNSSGSSSLRLGYNFPSENDQRSYISIPKGRKWVLSWYQNSGEPTQNRGVPLVRLITGNNYGTDSYVNTDLKGDVPIPTDGPWEWKRFYRYLDFSGDHLLSEHVPLGLDDVHDFADGVASENYFKPTQADKDKAINTIDRMQISWSWTGTGYYIHVDGIMLEDVTGTDRRTPGPYQEPPSGADIDYNRALSDGKTVYFTGPAYDEGEFRNVYGPDPSVTPDGYTNPEPYGDKFISSNEPYKTYLYFSNSTNKTSQTIFHSYFSNSATFKVANTNYPFGTSNNSSGWYEYRDTGDALTQEGFQVALGRVAIGGASWSANDPNNILDNGIGLPEDDDPNYPTPTLDVGGTSTFGQTREILLNPVPPPDTNLHAHWTLNSYDVDDDGNYLVRDVSGRNNHAILGRQGGGTFRDQGSDFVDHDPASDVINVSGNKSLFLQSSLASADRPWTFLTLGSNGSVSETETAYTYQGSNYPVDITDATKFNKSTITFWWKPSIENTNDDGNNRFIIGQDYQEIGGWMLYIAGNNPSAPADVKSSTANNDFVVRWQHESTIHASLRHDPSEGLYLDGWLGANDGGTYTPFRANEWHFVAIQTNHVDDKQSLWIYREGEGLLYYDVADYVGTADASTINRALVLNGSSLHNYDTRTNANGNYDEVRLYNSILTPRNIRYLYENPTGRARQLQPRPGMAVKHGYATFDVGRWPAGSGTIKTGDVVAIYANGAAYFHGYDVDGNPADVDPYISFDGKVKYLNRGMVRIGFAQLDERTAAQGASGYILYRDTPYPDNFDYGPSPTLSADANYVFAQPVAANSTYPETWRYQRFWQYENPLPASSRGNRGWTYFTPNDAEDLVIGEATIADTLLGNYSHFDTIDVYQFARKPSIVRESYNFTIKPEDFIGSGNLENHFFANTLFWQQNEGLLDGTFIAAATIGNAAIIDLSASKIQTGTIEAKVTVGGETKVLIDGINSRIVISD